MKLSRLVQVAAAFAPALAFGQVATPDQCTDDFDECKEDCTMEFGTSLTTREKFGRCLNGCTRKSDDCKERYFDVTSNHLDGDALTKKRARDPAADEPSSRGSSRPSGGDDGPRPGKRYDPDEKPIRDDEVDAKPSRRTPDPEPVHRTATRMSDVGEGDSKPAAEPRQAPHEKIDPMLSSDGPKPDPMLTPAADESPKARPPERAASRPVEDEAPPPKKKPVDEWVPGDDGPPPSAAASKKREPEPEAPPPPKAKPPAPKKKALDEWDPDSE